MCGEHVSTYYIYMPLQLTERCREQVVLELVGKVHRMHLGKEE